jgi:hypothetical protein
MRRTTLIRNQRIAEKDDNKYEQVRIYCLKTPIIIKVIYTIYNQAN